MGDEVQIESSLFSGWDYSVFAAMLVISAGIGAFYGFKSWRQERKSKSGSVPTPDTTEELLLGGRSLSVFPVAMSVLASFMSAITLLGTPSEVYRYGTMYWMINLAFVLVVPVTAHLYLPVFYNAGTTSAYAYLEKRFARFLRTMGTIIFTIHMLMYMPVVLYAPSLALSQVTGLSVLFSVLSIGIVCTFYTSIGGIKAVVWTDLFQTLLMFGSMFVITFKGAADEGGMGAVWQRNVDGQRVEFLNFDVDPTTRHTVWSLAIGGYFTWMGNYAVNQAMVQRYLTLPSLSAAQRCIWINLPTLWLLITITCLSGMVIYARYFNCDPSSVGKVASPDQLFPLFVMDSLGSIPGLPGLFVAGIFSGALSTVSSGVNSLAAVTLEDIVKTYIRPDISELWATRLTKLIAMTYGFLAIALVAVAAKLGDVLQAGLTIHGMIGGPMLGIFTLGMFLPWINKWGAAVGLLSGFIMSFWIGLGAFVHKVPVPKAPISIDGCPELYKNFTKLDSLPVFNSTNTEDVFYGYRLSYMWYSAIGFVTVIIVGLLVSLLTGKQNPEEVDPALISPLMVRIYAKLNVPLGSNLPKKPPDSELTAPQEKNPQEKNLTLQETVERKNSLITRF